MSADPIDDYLQALIGDATVPADAANAATVASTAPAPLPGQADAALLAELDAAFDQASAQYRQQPAPPAPAASSADALLAELDAAFDQASAQYRQQPAPPAPAASSADALLAELDAAFDQASAQYRQQQAPPAPAASSTDALLAELDAAFDQASAQYRQQQAPPAPAASSADDLLAELDAAFDQAREQFVSAQSASVGSNTADDAGLQALFDAECANYQQAQQRQPVDAPPQRRIPPAPIGPPVLAISANTAQPVWQAAGAPAPGIAPPEQRRRASERTSRWLRLRCGQQPYALELLKVQEVVLLAPLLSLRGTAPHMLGIMNLRGQVVPVMDLGLYLGSDAVQTTAATRIVVLESEGQSLGLRVSAVDDVASLTESQIEPPDTARLCRFSNHLFRGVARLSGPPIILLDANALLN